MRNYRFNFIKVTIKKSTDAYIFWFPHSVKPELLALPSTIILLNLFLILILFFGALQNVLYISELQSSSNRVRGRYGGYDFSTQVLALPKVHWLEHGTIFVFEINNPQIYQAMKKQNMQILIFVKY